MAVKMRPTDTWTKRPHGALLSLGTDFLYGIVENRREPSGISGIPLVLYRKSYLTHLQTMEGTLSGWEFNWGGCLLKSNASAQRYPWPGWKSGWKCNGIRVLDCETHMSIRCESRS